MIGVNRLIIWSRKKKNRRIEQIYKSNEKKHRARENVMVMNE